MAAKIPNPLKIFSTADAKTRIFIVVGIAVGIGLIGFLIFRYFGGGAATIGPSRVATAPGSLQSVPGAQMTPEFYRAVMQANTQAAQQAQITGGSAVPTLINVPVQQQGTATQECTVICPSPENANVADDINGLLKLGKLSQAEANRLLELAKSNVPLDEYAAALDDLIKQGKLTLDQARGVLAKYKNQRANALANESAQFMDGLAKTGQLSVDVANQLLDLQKRNLSPAEYSAELQRLVREGKLSPAMAAQLLAQYTQQKMREQAKEGAFGLKQMAKGGEITADVANLLASLQGRNVPVDQYAAELDRLVREGKLTPAAAAKLLEQYRKQRSELGPNGTLEGILGEELARNQLLVNDFVKGGRLSPADAKTLLDLEKTVTDPAECKNLTDKLVNEKRSTPPDAQVLLTQCQKKAALRVQVKKLLDMQANNATVEDYTKELKKAVAVPLITPEQAATVLEQYRAVVTPVTPPPGAGIGPEAAIPGAEGFAAMQSRLAQAPEAPTAPPTPEFVAPPPAPVATAPVTVIPTTTVIGEDEQLRRQRIEAMQNAMSAQSQSLIAAWQPSVMQHREGTPAAEKTKKEEETTKSTATETTKETTTTKEKASKKVLIKAGTVAFAVLDTAVNSDYPDTPVMATIINGPLKGAELLGKLSLAQGKDRVSLNFNLMNKEEWTTSKSINAFAIDPDTARTVMASSVDYHYFKRFGAIMATSFLQGYSAGITNEGNSTTGIFGTSTTHPALSPGNKIAVGLGQVGTTLGGMVANYINTPATVRVNAGVSLGILFMADVTDA